MKCKKRGSIFFVIDAFIAAAILFLTITVVLNSRAFEPESQEIEQANENVAVFFSTTSLYALPIPIAQQIVQNNDVVDSRTSVLDALAELYAKGKIDLAEQLIGNSTELILDAQYGTNITIDKTHQLYNRSLERRTGAKIGLVSIKLNTFFSQATTYNNKTDFNSANTGELACDNMYANAFCDEVIDATGTIAGTLPCFAPVANLTALGVVTPVAICTVHTNAVLHGPFITEVQIWP